MKWRVNGDEYIPCDAVVWCANLHCAHCANGIDVPPVNYGLPQRKPVTMCRTVNKAPVNYLLSGDAVVPGREW